MSIKIGDARFLRLPMTLVRTGRGADTAAGASELGPQPVPALGHPVPPALPQGPNLEQTVRAWHEAGHSQRAIARELSIDRRKVNASTTRQRDRAWARP